MQLVIKSLAWILFSVAALMHKNFFFALVLIPAPNKESPLLTIPEIYGLSNSAESLPEERVATRNLTAPPKRR
jgi:hypothetical protein